MRLSPPRAFAAFAALALFAACDTGLELDSLQQADVIDPPDLHGTLVVKAPSGAELPSWDPSTPPAFGPGNAHKFNEDVYHVYHNGAHVHTARLGAELSVPKGRYIVAVNDTKLNVEVKTDQTTAVQCGRIEVTDVSGTFRVDADAGDFSGGTLVLGATMPTGVGLNVLPGSYEVTVFYQNHTKNFDVTVDGVERVEPNDLRGYLKVLPPDDITMPSWAPDTAPKFGPGNAHSYDNGVYHVYTGGKYMETLPLGDAFYGPEGRYLVAVNDTKLWMDIERLETSTVRAGRIEVTDVSGTFRVDADAGDFSGGSLVLGATIPTGLGITVLPGGYEVTVFYQNHTETFPLDLVTD